MDEKIESESRSFKSKTNIIISRENRFYINSYLFEIRKRTTSTYQDVIIKKFLNYINKTVHEVKKIDVINFFKDVLDNENISYASKNTYRAGLKSFFYYVEALIIDKFPDFTNPVPNNRIYRFSQNETDVKRKSERNEKMLSKAQLMKILDFCKKNFSKKVFIFFALATCTGARDAELRSIRINDVNIKERYFETGFEHGARKSTLKSKESLLFFFPENFGIYLENYLHSQKKKKYLFSTKENTFPGKNFSIYYYRKMSNALNFKFSMHFFRHSLITHLKKNKCPRDEREMLLNHSASSTQARYYEHLTIHEKREIYDRYFPYYKIPYF